MFSLRWARESDPYWAREQSTRDRGNPWCMTGFSHCCLLCSKHLFCLSKAISQLWLSLILIFLSKTPVFFSRTNMTIFIEITRLSWSAAATQATHRPIWNGKHMMPTMQQLLWLRWLLMTHMESVNDYCDELKCRADDAHEDKWAKCCLQHNL